MEGFPKTMRVKGGLEIVVRPLERSDEAELFRFFSSLPENERLFLRDDVTQREVVHRWIEELGSPELVRLVALREGRIVGDATLRRPARGWMRHVGEVRAVVAPESQRHGVASTLVRELCGQAVLCGLDKLVVMAAQDQAGALTSLERLGFVREAVLRNHVTDIRGKKRDLIIMANHTEELWHRMADMILDSESAVQH
jgi:RimJ/RimL family protein N-acetyltransferase